MLRYLKEAFWARPELGGFGRIPWNALAVTGVAILGFGEPSIWLAGAALETIYLYALATNPRFQNAVDAVASQQLRDAPASVVPNLDAASRERLARLAEKRARVEQLYRDSPEEDFLFDSNREALARLEEIAGRLMVSRRNLLEHGSATEADLRSRIAAAERELATGTGSGSLRESREATLAILRQRLRNVQRREETLAEIESDLTRIDAQFDLAIDDATLKGRPTAISANIDLVSHLLDDALLDTGSTQTTDSPSRQLEN
ncbi:MAG TPA: hypothetical protein VF787_16380 [Thermoanaerobaculia bacterium]